LGVSDGALGGLRVLDLATIYAGPLTAMLLGDFGADVIKVEHPRGDPLRTHGPARDGHGLWWKVLGRNKRAITLNLSTPGGQATLLALAAKSDVLIENFRPGIMEHWNLGYHELSADNPGLIMLRVTGFGQFGPYAQRPGFGTLAESMSGFAAITGQPDQPPTLPPFGLADGISGLAGALAALLALYHRDARGGMGQVIDLAIIEPILTILGAQPTIYDQLGIIQGRTGNRSGNNAPRNTYKTRDGRWVAISTSADAIAARVLELVGHPEVVDLPWFKTGRDRALHADELDEMVGAWVGERDADDVSRRFEEAGAAIAPVYDIAQIMEDPQFRALGTILQIDDEDLGLLKMQNVMFRMLDTPGRVRFPGRRIGQDTDAVLTDVLGMSGADIARLRGEGAL
jgi:crotonobetainyl-CoA:carnitine CoA-transferase CaiB-like acyl-CoA transferase